MCRCGWGLPVNFGVHHVILSDSCINGVWHVVLFWLSKSSAAFHRWRIRSLLSHAHSVEKLVALFGVLACNVRLISGLLALTQRVNPFMTLSARSFYITVLS